VTTSNQFNDCKINQNHSGDGDNVQIKSAQSQTVLDWIFSWTGFVGSIASISGVSLGVVWYWLHNEYGWWFFGLN
jgi:hypothetical protein